ncbi:MAG TPA: phosphatidylserine/phosphatidylglycerophosphate/cardiolipin synthase family protein [Gaiellaceae bacterium]|nr:phosphatidylserine/phosphatidylglycerophosphate/cardiolipin synthase family protein [Gaiellaceae bacterium]
MLEITTQRDGGQSSLDVARRIAEFIGRARRSLDFAHYDFHLEPETAAVVGGAVKEAAARGVEIRFLYNVDHRNPIPVPPPPEPDAKLIASLAVPARAIAGVPDLMHHKYVVRDDETVWTGSMNWTDDSFSRQENVIVTATSLALATRFTANFDELWERGAVERSGHVDTTPVPVGALQVRTWFTPGHGENLSHRIAKAIAKARRRIRICSPVITAAPVLGSLAQVISEGRVDVAGCVDRPQIGGVIHQWGVDGNASWKLPLLERVMAAPFSAKPSTPWLPGGSLHDFMHAKVTVADDTIFTGSFNLSRSGELNAENVLEVTDPVLAERLAAYVDEVRTKYPRFEKPGEPMVPLVDPSF